MARTTKSTTTYVVTPTNSDIARRAFELYYARGCEDGYDIQDWLQAERELSEATAPSQIRSRRAPRPRVSQPVLPATGEAADAIA